MKYVNGNWRLVWCWLGVIIVVFAVGVVAGAYQQIIKFYSPLETADSVPPASITPVPVKPIQVYLRLGTIVSISKSSFVLQSDKLGGQGQESITVNFVPGTQFIEVRSPEFMTPERKAILKAGGRVVERIKVAPDKLLVVGQEVAVVSDKDVSGQMIISAARVEYQKVVP